MTEKPGRDTTRQREAGAAARAETRRRLLQAANEEFAERGYVAATVSRIASRAGVTVQTLYLAWGSKRELLRAHMDAALSDTPGSAYVEALPHMIERAMGDPNAHTTVTRIAQLHCQIASRAALGWQLYRDAAASDEEIAADWQTLQKLRHETFTELIGSIPAGSLRVGTPIKAAVDTAWAVASPDTYELLVRTAGYTIEEYERWIADTLCAALLEP